LPCRYRRQFSQPVHGFHAIRPLGLKRGNPQPIDEPNIANAEGDDGSDIGAYEADPILRINGMGKTGGDIWLSVNSMLGRTYRVESTDELPPTWSVLTNGVPGTGGRFQAIDGGRPACRSDSIGRCSCRRVNF
jgi:hypothetical protein